MEIRRRTRKVRTLILLIIFSNIIYSNINYQIIELPNSIPELIYYNGILSKDKIDNNNLETNFFQYPADISLFNFKTKQGINLSFLNYGTLEDKINNQILDKTNSYEFLVQYTLNKNLNWGSITLNPGLVYSKINNYYSTAIISDLRFNVFIRDKDINLYLKLTNVGFIFDEDKYLNTNFNFGLSKFAYKNNFQYAYDLKYNSTFDFFNHIISIKKNINNSVRLFASVNSNKKDLMIDNIINDLFSGFAIGIEIDHKNLNYGFGVISFGPAGNVYGITFRFK